MKSPIPRRVSMAVAIGLLLPCFSALRLDAAEPAWWTASPTSIKMVAPPNNAGPVNHAQLKNVAKKAALYLNNTLPSPGAGPTINAMVAGFADDPATALLPVNLGQLKAVAKPFYDRLLEVGFDTNASLQAHGGTAAGNWPFAYPWDDTTEPSANLAPASIGQLKWVFSFDLTGF